MIYVVMLLDEKKKKKMMMGKVVYTFLQYTTVQYSYSHNHNHNHNHQSWVGSNQYQRQKWHIFTVFSA